MRLYFDACCLNRPFDDQQQLRIRLETEAVRTILRLCEEGIHDWVASRVLRWELEQTPDADRRQLTLDLLSMADEEGDPVDQDRLRALELARQNIPAFDAAHLATAERLRCDLLLTTDDTLIKRAARTITPALRIRVTNPLAWLQENAL
jgi:predicted nucleic acid-binding protein